MGVHIRVKRDILHLDVYWEGKRTLESLHIKVPKDKAQRKEIMRLAEICRSQREAQLLAGAWNIQDPVAGKKKLITYLEERAKDYSDPSVMKSLIYHIKKFNTGEAILISHITPQWVSDFYKYLECGAGLSQMSAAQYAKRLHTALQKAVVANIITTNPAESVKRIPVPETDLVFLNIDEIQKLADAKLDDCCTEVRRAFLFACHTGLRVCDIETITWNEIERNPMQIIKRQVKTKFPVYIPLSDTAKRIIDDGIEHKPDDKIFGVPYDYRRNSYKVFKRWAKAAGITKHISWHTARRTFATLALENGADPITVAKLLGHKGLDQVMKYAKATDRSKRNAIAALPEIRL